MLDRPPPRLLDVPVGAEVDLGDAAPAVARPSRAIGYVRVSLSREEMISPEIQEQHILEHCRRRGYVHLGVLSDLDLSGRSFKKRARVRQAAQMIADGEADVIVVWKWSRFGRNTRESVINLGVIEDLGGRVESATEDVDSRTPLGNFQRGFFLQLAEFESDRAGEVWKDVHARRTRLGLTHNGGARLGYLRVRAGRESSYVPDRTGVDGGPPMGTALADCYRQYVEGAGFAGLARQLNEQGLRTTLGNEFTAASLRATMDAGFAAGLLPFADGGSRTTVRFRRGRHEPLIDEPTWLAYRAERALRRAQGSRVGEPVASRLLGLLRCPYCLASMTVESTAAADPARRYRSYSCSRSRRGSLCPGTSMVVEQLERHVLDWLRALPVPLTACRAAQDAAGEQLAAARDELRQLQEQTAAWQAQPTLEPAELYRLIQGVEARRSGLRDEVGRLEQRLFELSRATDEVVQELVAGWDDLTAADANRRLRRLVGTVYVQAGRRGVRTSAADRVLVLPVWCDEDPVATAHAAGRPPTPSDVRGPRPGATRVALLDHLAAGPATAAALAEATGITPQSVRLQLRRLESEGLVRGRAGAGSRPGRPGRVFSLADQS